MIYFEKDVDGNITALKTNMIEINRLKTQLLGLIIDKVSGTTTTDLSIPIGNVISNNFFSGRGPRIPVKILSVSSATATFTNNFTSAGINQTRHQVFMNFKVSVMILLPSCTTTTVVESQVCVAETIIVGSVPDSFTYFNGTDTAEDAANNYFNFK